MLENCFLNDAKGEFCVLLVDSALKECPEILKSPGMRPLVEIFSTRLSSLMTVDETYTQYHSALGNLIGRILPVANCEEVFNELLKNGNRWKFDAPRIEILTAIVTELARFDHVTVSKRLLDFIFAIVEFVIENDFSTILPNLVNLINRFPAAIFKTEFPVEKFLLFCIKESDKFFNEESNIGSVIVNILKFQKVGKSIRKRILSLMENGQFNVATQNQLRKFFGDKNTIDSHMDSAENSLEFQLNAIFSSSDEVGTVHKLRSI